MRKEIFCDYSFKDKLEVTNLVNQMEQITNFSNDNIQNTENNGISSYPWNN